MFFCLLVISLFLRCCSVLYSVHSTSCTETESDGKSELILKNYFQVSGSQGIIIISRTSSCPQYKLGSAIKIHKLGHHTTKYYITNDLTLIWPARCLLILYKIKVFFFFYYWLKVKLGEKKNH